MLYQGNRCNARLFSAMSSTRVVHSGVRAVLMTRRHVASRRALVVQLMSSHQWRSCDGFAFPVVPNEPAHTTPTAQAGTLMQGGPTHPAVSRRADRQGWICRSMRGWRGKAQQIRYAMYLRAQREGHIFGGLSASHTPQLSRGEKVVTSRFLRLWHFDLVCIATLASIGRKESMFDCSNSRVMIPISTSKYYSHCSHYLRKVLLLFNIGDGWCANIARQIYVMRQRGADKMHACELVRSRQKVIRNPRDCKETFRLLVFRR
jgi:hypothetical protein